MANDKSCCLDITEKHQFMILWSRNRPSTNLSHDVCMFAQLARYLSQLMWWDDWVSEWWVCLAECMSERESAPLSRSRMASPWADNTEKGWGKVPEVAFRASSVWFGSATSGLIGWVLCNFFPRDWVKRTSVTRGSYIGKPNSRNLLERKLHFRVGCTPHFSPKHCVNLVLAV